MLNNNLRPIPGQADHVGPSRVLLLLIAVGCGAMVANLFYAQTLIDLIGPEIGMSRGLAGLITTLTQLGYGLGLFLIVPLADLFENRRIALTAMLLTIIGCLVIAGAKDPITFLVASILTGVSATGTQVMVLLASHLTSPNKQGRVIGIVTSGLLCGVMLSRPIANFMAGTIGWRSTFMLSAGILALIFAGLCFVCPRRRPKGSIPYGEALRSTLQQLARHRVVRMRACYQALMFAAFNLFWTAAPLSLVHDFGLGHHGIGVFALAGAGGALVAPIAGWLSDLGRTRTASLGAMITVGGGFLIAYGAVYIGSLILFAVIAIGIDAAVQLNQITSQKLIFSLDPHARGRINAVYMTSMFMGGAVGSMLGSASYAAGGWYFSAMLGMAIGVAVVLIFLFADRGASNSTP
ncbi:MFS transporter [Dickeya zeae]|uniref:MFS transporter n=1 Tax=Dickeya zeae TaxID=204042 RepID=A0AAE6YZW8_9GAMM|nr:MFS transporter [Dickeya zeae]QIZ51746.1 MFS transporter [Dickeya zeae]